MAIGYTIRAAQVGDAARIAVLSRELGYEVTPDDALQRLRMILARDDAIVLVAVDSEDIPCGWLQAHCSIALESGVRVEIVGLVVSERMRRRAVGRSLVADAESWAKRISAETMVVRSNVKRVESHAFYPSLGFSKAKTQVVYRKRTDI